MTLQDRFGLPGPYEGLVSYPSPDDAYGASARASKALWPALLDSACSAYLGGGIWCWTAYTPWTVDRPSCWRGDPAVDAEIGRSLATAQRCTAAYILALGARIPPAP